MSSSYIYKVNRMERPLPERNMADTLYPNEKLISKKASQELGFDVLVYFDGRWICDPVSKERQYLGYGSTPEEAIQDCRDYAEAKKIK
jgi:hypothetical protein